MQIAMVGLGRMGMNMALRLLKGGHEVVAYNRSPDKVKEIEKEGAIGAHSLEDVVKKLKAPRIVWLMLPAGAATDDHVSQFSKLLSKNDLLIDGANNYYKEDIRHAEQLKAKGIRFMDAGVSGGIWGLKIGYCTMVGGDAKDFKAIEPALKTLAPKDGYLHCGPAGSGHFVKMVHNGIEYGMMQAYAEGFELMKAAPYDLPLAKIAHLWNQGSVVRSWLLELLHDALTKEGDLSSIQGYVEDSGEGRWTVQQAIDTSVAAPVIALSLFQRFGSRQPDAFANKVLAALRNEFGGHAVKPGVSPGKKGKK